MRSSCKVVREVASCRLIGLTGVLKILKMVDEVPNRACRKALDVYRRCPLQFQFVEDVSRADAFEKDDRNPLTEPGDVVPEKVYCEPLRVRSTGPRDEVAVGTYSKATHITSQLHGEMRLT